VEASRREFRRQLAEDVRRGLAGGAPGPSGGGAPRSLPCKYLYDDRGSRLFDQITRQPEYYQTRTEEAILEQRGDELIAQLRPRELVELGSGVGRKVRLLLDAMAGQRLLRSCVLFDINATFLEASVASLALDYPELDARGVEGDFLEDLTLLGPGGDRLVLFLAGTIGNLAPADVPAFLRRVAGLLSRGDGFLVGLDLVKDPRRLEAAYNDAAGVTADFNRNLLAVVNRELGADFDLQAFEHVARWDPQGAYIDIRLRSQRAQTVTIPGADLVVDFAPGDEIRTEISCKYTRESFAGLLADTGLRLTRWDTDADEQFALALLEPDVP